MRPCISFYGTWNCRILATIIRCNQVVHPGYTGSFNLTTLHYFKEVVGVSRHVEFWQEAIRTLNTTSFVEPNTTQRNFISLWSELKLEGLSLWYTRNMNQDPLENFFGRVRAINHRNNSPNP
ncbi:hypothetical protein ABMA27_003067 [Loxostege sticticalis]|uniref:Transposable element P transposase-like RNase H C-terminal domain-containing protein n=1 Tax=Loxostege sticticalis TaxID=481309 RepID=A0ABR3HS23_LOXSC